MSDVVNERNLEDEAEFTTVNLNDIRTDTMNNLDELENVQSEGRIKRRSDVEEVNATRPSGYLLKPRKDRRTSLIWTKFTIINKRDQIAACNICNQRMSIRSTSNNLKKHLERKHGYSIKLGVLPKRTNHPKTITPTPKPKLSELAGISDEGITLKVVGEDGEEEHFQVIGEQFLSQEVVQEEPREHDYSTLDHQMEIQEGEVVCESSGIGQVSTPNEPRPSQPKQAPPRLYTPQQTYAVHRNETNKRQRIMELQIECLENKKYNMQLEALMMEQQLNLPRSIFTEPLHYADTQTRGTQTDVGGSDTKVFYITDKRGGRPMQQLFALQDLDF